MKLSNIALLSAAAATASAYDHKSAAIVELEVYMTDIVNNMDQYLAMQAANPGQAFPAEIMSAYVQMARGNTISYTSFFSTIDESEVEFLMTGVSWYSARLAPSVSAALLEAGIDTNDENVAAATSQAATASQAAATSQTAATSQAAAAANTINSSNLVISSNLYSNYNSTVTANVTDISTTLATITSCDDGKCTEETTTVKVTDNGTILETVTSCGETGCTASASIKVQSSATASTTPVVAENLNGSSKLNFGMGAILAAAIPMLL
ncbi:hypothetical protein TPHA_0I02200 [Tetrapisispora phaffii CBS 4417]|uniref:Uncharacterized protein n=1 Tax=Tetrapisispora phaffii (strain ATCC 24235 / CBS 4417 / NBRC 1672 / NRRL Y-8282 / UCD 70-5) TaxID=1071381 RepID=G8BXU6_TETPH|nr:hypothetical protein TPHA_0I02200 [Tetrapisispora phaffii CBS 4417]CCE64724.1 hypothetical protein TPHA_0I02200 [Tetrapisispora phaffii CBS 4417]